MVTKRNLAKRIIAAILSMLLFAGTLGECPVYVRAAEPGGTAGMEEPSAKDSGDEEIQDETNESPDGEQSPPDLSDTELEDGEDPAEEPAQEPETGEEDLADGSEEEPGKEGEQAGSGIQEKEAAAKPVKNKMRALPEQPSRAGTSGEKHVHSICLDENCTSTFHESSEWKPWNGKDKINMKLGWRFYLTEDVTLTPGQYNPWNDITSMVAICLNGHVVKSEIPNQPIITTQSSIILTDCQYEDKEYKFSVDPETGLWTQDENGSKILKGGCITGHRGGEDGGNPCPAIAIERGTFEMHRINIVGNKNKMKTQDGQSIGRGGSAVYVYGEGIADGPRDARFNMYSGKIVGNSVDMSQAAGEFSACVENRGDFRMLNGEIAENGGVDNAGGGVMNLGRFTMEDGIISGNSGRIGGGIYDRGTELEINGGQITNNHASDRGGGICYYGQAFTLAGGSISGNTAGNGGGVCLGMSGSFTMNGGTISQNMAKDGGGVFWEVGGYGTKTCGVTFGGGKVTGNEMQTEDNHTEEMHKSPSNFFINLTKYLENPQIAIAEGGIQEGSEIGVTVAGISADPPRIFSKAASKDYSAFFQSDDPAYKIEAKDDYALQVAVNDADLAEFKRKIAVASREISEKRRKTLTEEARTAYDALTDDKKKQLNYRVFQQLEDLETSVWFNSRELYGFGTKEIPYRLQDSNMYLLVQYMREKEVGLKGKYFELIEDIREDIGKWNYLMGKLYESNGVIPFEGHFDGRGYTIGIKITENTVKGAGLFVHNKGVIQNLNVAGEISPEDISYKGEIEGIGGIAGINDGQIINCTSLVKVSGTGNVGGIAGFNSETGVIRGCTSTDNITGSGSYVGAIAGQNKGIVKECSYRKNADINTNLSAVGDTQADAEGITSTDTMHIHTDCGEAACSLEGEHKSHSDTNVHKWQPWDKADDLPEEDGYYYLTKDVTLSETWVQELTDYRYLFHLSLYLCLNGHVIKTDKPDTTIINNKGDTIFTDCSSDVHKFSVSSDGLWMLDEESGTEELTGGCITGASGTGHAVWNQQKLFMYNINIVGNGSVGKQSEGAGLMNMSEDGEYGYFKMHSGAIIGNCAARGAGVYNGSDLDIYGGTITRNRAEEQGGGIFGGGKFSKIRVYGGKIINNSAVQGAGIYAGDVPGFRGTSMLEIADAEITGNKASENGAGIYATTCDLQISGSPKIYENSVVDENNQETVNNVYLSKGLASTGTLNEDAKIGITIDPDRLWKVKKDAPLKLGNASNSWLNGSTVRFISDQPGYMMEAERNNGLFFKIDPQAQAEAVKSLIHALGKVTLENVLDKAELIERAREAYEELDEEQKKQIPEDVLKKLTDAEELYKQATGGDNQGAVDQAVEKINAIPEPVTYDTDCREKIEEARKAYDALTSAQKKLVPEDSLKKLTDAEAAYDKLAADAVIEKINKIGTVNQANAEEKLPLIEEARKAYNSLDPDQKKLIEPEELKKLTDAEAAYDQATGGSNQAAADRASAKIDAIPSPVQYDWKCAQKIEEAREAYDDLTDFQKSLVPEEKKQKLTEAEAAYDRLAAENAKEKIDAIGTVTPGTVTEKKQEIEDARDAYDSLTDQQKELLTEEDKKKLTDAEKEYDQAAGGSDQKAADKVCEKIDAIPTPVQDNEETRQKIEDAEDAYENLTGTQKDMVPEEDRKKLEDAKDAYDKIQADKVSEKIDAIGTVTPETVTEKKQEIEDARDAYEKLTEDQKELVPPEDKDKLTDAEKLYDQTQGSKDQKAADRVKEKIDAIPDPVEKNETCKAKIEEAREAYENLTGTQKDMVPESSKKKLEQAEKSYDRLAAAEVMEKIDAIGETTAENAASKKDLIEEARDAYDKLTEEQKELVTPEEKKKLTDAEKVYDEATGGRSQAAADEVKRKIDAIPDPVQNNEDTRQKIEDAREAYDKLTSVQKDMVPESSRKKLEQAEKEYEKLAEADRLAVEKVKTKIEAIGDVTPENVIDKKDLIEDAREAYDALTERQKEMITPEEKKKLTDAEKIYDTATGGHNQAAADRAKDKIDAIPDPVKNDQETKEKLEEARDAYDSLTTTQKDMVPEDSQKKLQEAEEVYKKLVTEEVKNKIDAIGEVTPENVISKKDLIEDARETYDKLTDDQKELIEPEDKKKLTDAEKIYDEATGGHNQAAADKVTEKIDAIPDQIRNDEETKQKIEEAKEAYDNLTGTQKDMVPEDSRKKLEESEEAYNKLAADEVRKKIHAIGEVTPENVVGKKDLIQDAREAYDALTEEQKKLITPLDKKKLTDAEKLYDNAAGGHNQAAADRAKDKIDAIPSPVKNDQETKEKLEDAKDAYDSLTSTQKDMVPEETKKKLEHAEKDYNNLVTDEVKEKIDAIGEVTPENVVSKKDLIEDAREAYDKLNQDQKDLIDPEEKKKLTDAEKLYDDATGGKNQVAADKVTEKIDAIPDQIQNDEETKQKIEEAKEAYDNLTGTQKDMVPEDSRKKLEESEEAYNKLAADEVRKKINAIGEVTPENVVGKKDLIEDARNAYDALTEDQKKLITPPEKKKLTDAEKLYDDATGGKNQAAADQVKDKINAIPSPVKNDQETKEKLEDAKDAYDSLTTTQKDMVPEETKKKLEYAEKDYNKLVTDEVKQKIEAIGEVTPENVISKKDLIEEARKAYDKLTSEQKALIDPSDVKKLTDAEKIYEDAAGSQNQAADKVKEKIDAIGEITPENAASKKQLIEEARTAYDALDEEQKKLITPAEKKKLTDAEKIYDTATGGKNQAAADQAKQKIDAIPNPVAGDWNSKTKIEEARKAYDKLTSTQKDMVPEASKKKLEDAEKTYRSLVSKADEDAVQAVINKINAIGTVVKTDACGKKIKDARSSYNLMTAQQKKLFPPAILKKLADAEKKYADLTKTPALPPEQQKQIEEIAEKLGVSKKEAEEIQKVAEKLGVDPETLLVTDKTITGMKTEDDVTGAAFGKLQVKGTKVSSKKFTLKWKKVKGADGYLVYGTRCGKGRKPKLIKTLKKSSMTSLTVKKLKKGTPYRYIVRAYKQVGKKKLTIAVAKTVHIFTTGGKYTNPKSVKVNKAKVTVKKGKKFKLKGKEVKTDKKKKIRHHRVVCYESTNNKIATVTKKGGVIKGKKKGTCKIYVYTQNGIYKTVKVTVK